MKKLFILCLTALFALQAKAQIPNPGFETRKPDGTPTNWQRSSFVVIPVDSSCISQGWDSINVSTTDAHSGMYGYEIRVATVCTDAYSGEVQASRTDSTGFIDQRLPIHGQPSAFTFYYKLSSVGGDMGIADAFMQDEMGNATGDGLIQLPAAANWTLATLPMNYTMVDTGGYLTLKFYLGNPAGVHYGSRFVIDDLEQDAPAAVITHAKESLSLQCFPSPAQSSVSIRLNGPTAGSDANISVVDMSGRIAMHTTMSIPQDKTFTLDTRSLAPGHYFVRITESSRTFTGRFLK